MGYIDSDTHIIECGHTWDFFDPKEIQYQPAYAHGHQFLMQEVCIEEETLTHVWQSQVFPPGSVDLTNPEARVTYMDQLGVDVQVLYPTWFLSNHVGNAVAEAAMMRSYNRWLGERTAETGGRLQWAVNVPVRMMDRALEEIDFGRSHGAVAVFIKGFTNGMSVRDPYLTPIWEKAQDLDMAIGFHVGSEDVRLTMQDPGKFLHLEILPVPCAIGALLQCDLFDRYPRLRWAALEAGAAWVPYVAQEAFRHLDIRGFGPNGWQDHAREAFAKYNLFVSCQMDDDLNYLANIFGENSFVHGTDFGHLDVGSDPNGLHIIATREDLPLSLRRKIVDSVGRRLYNIDKDFCPAPPASVEGYAINSHQHESAAFLAQPAPELVPWQSVDARQHSRVG